MIYINTQKYKQIYSGSHREWWIFDVQHSPSPVIPGLQIKACGLQYKVYTLFINLCYDVIIEQHYEHSPSPHLVMPCKVKSEYQMRD